MKKSILKYYPFLPLLLLCGFYICRAVAFPIHDFANYYFGGKFLAEGNFNTTIYFPYQFNKAISSLGYQNIFANYAPNTPLVALLFLPISFIALAKAKLIFNCVSICLFVLSICRLLSFNKINPQLAILIPILFLVPIKNNLLFGQVYFLLFFLLSEGWIAYEKKRWKSMAFFWSLAILLKIFPALLLLLLIFKKQWKALLYLSSCVFLLIGITILFTGIDVWTFCFKEVLPKASNGEIASSFVDNYQSVFMFLKRLLVYNAIENPHGFYHTSSYFSVTVLAFKIGFVSLGYFVTRNSKNNLQVFCFWILAMILISPYGSTYTFLLMLFPFLALLKSEISYIKKSVICGILLLINNLPLSFFIENDFPFSYLRLCFLIAFFIVFVSCFFQKSALIKTIVIGCITVFIGTFSEQSKLEKSNGFLTDKSPILIYNYQIKNNQLTYFYWNEKGENQTSIPFKNSSVIELDIKENQIVAKNKMQTFDTNHKYKPMLIDDKTILYLSDYDRGIGFYTLRKIELH